ncbi:hypothetical protein [Sphingomonas morindae]|uniref:Uncharacterized protein n=1 Tax=Sphingomonas morindae TaxID=1541170 RepID=A0ABY4X6F5_9SPHN|nr:hypothetical protein [Sphingomonas morindae]USI72509.1 hypothetical protein LHA26_14630 [Sphingomonas morindae]
MRRFLALIVPWRRFFLIERPISGCACLMLQATLLGWLPAALWSRAALRQHARDRRIQRRIARDLAFRASASARPPRARQAAAAWTIRPGLDRPWK